MSSWVMAGKTRRPMWNGMETSRYAVVRNYILYCRLREASDRSRDGIRRQRQIRRSAMKRDGDRHDHSHLHAAGRRDPPLAAALWRYRDAHRPHDDRL